MEQLLGLEFRRNKYGLSHVTQKVTDVQVVWDLNHITKHWKPIFMVKGKRDWYDINELVFLNH